MGDLSYLFKGMFTPGCFAEFASSWGIFIIFTFWLIAATYMNRETVLWRKSMMDANRDKTYSVPSILITFGILLAGIWWGYGYIGDTRADAMKTGILEVVHNGAHRTYTKGTEDFDRQMALLFFCQYLLVFFALIGVWGAIKHIKKRREFPGV